MRNNAQVSRCNSEQYDHHGARNFLTDDCSLRGESQGTQCQNGGYDRKVLVRRYKRHGLGPYLQLTEYRG